MTNVTTTRALAACAGTIALTCAVIIQPASAADIRAMPQYGGPPVVEERYVYQEPPRAYRYEPAPPPVYYDYAPPAVVPVPEPYYVPQRRVYVDPGYGVYGRGPYVAGGYGYHHHHHHQRGWGHRRW
jgi:hypothetical protein